MYRRLHRRGGLGLCTGPCRSMSTAARAKKFTSSTAADALVEGPAAGHVIGLMLSGLAMLRTAGGFGVAGLGLVAGALLSNSSSQVGLVVVIRAVVSPPGVARVFGDFMGRFGRA